MISLGAGIHGGMIITPDFRKSGTDAVQLTYFTKDGQPSGHTTFKKLADALDENFLDVDHPVSRLKKNTDPAKVFSAYEEALFEPHNDEILHAPFHYLSPLRPLTGVAVEGFVSSDLSGRMGVLSRYEPLDLDTQVRLNLFPMSPEAIRAAAEELAVMLAPKLKSRYARKLAENPRLSRKEIAEWMPIESVPPPTTDLDPDELPEHLREIGFSYVDDEGEAYTLQANYERAISRTSTYIGNLEGHVLRHAGIVWRPYPMESALVGYLHPDPMIFIVSHFAPKNLREGRTLMQEAKHSDIPMAIAVPEYQAGMLRKLGWTEVAQIPQFFAGEMVIKTVLVNEGMTDWHLQKLQAHYQEQATEYAANPPRVIPLVNMGDLT